MNDIELRFQRLERDNRRLRWALAVLALSVIAVLATFPLVAGAQNARVERRVNQRQKRGRAGGRAAARGGRWWRLVCGQGCLGTGPVLDPLLTVEAEGEGFEPSRDFDSPNPLSRRAH